MIASSGLPTWSMIVETKSNTSLESQATCRSQDTQKAAAACGPLLEPITAAVSPHERHGVGKTIVKPTTLVEGVVDSKKLNCPGSIVSPFAALRGFYRAGTSSAAKPDDEPPYVGGGGGLRPSQGVCFQGAAPASFATPVEMQTAATRLPFC